MTEARLEEIGRVERFFAQPSVAVVALGAPLRVGELIYIKGHTTDFRQTVTSLQVDHQPVADARAGQAVGLQVTQRCRRHDVVYRLAPGEDPRA